MESQVPGLGGAYYEGDEIVIYAPASATRADVLRGLAKAAPTLTLEPTARRQLAAGTRIRLRTGHFAFSQLVAWKQRLAPRLHRVATVSFSDVDEARNQISIGLVHGTQAARVLAAAETIGIPAEALNIHVRSFELSSTTLRDQVSSVAGGMQIANTQGTPCTVGWNVHRGESAPDGEEGFFTAGHCTSGTAGGGSTHEMYQETTSRQIGYITQNPLWNVSDTACTFSYCTRADAMYVRYDDASESLGSSMAQPASVGTSNNAGSITISTFWTNLSGTATLLVGSSIDKVGRTTGWTRGTLANTCAKTNVAAGGSHFYTVLCASKVQNAASGQGDSGAPVFQIGENGIARRGILFSTAYVGEINDPNRNWDLNNEGLRASHTACTYSYSTWTQINLWLPQPPF